MALFSRKKKEEEKPKPQKAAKEEIASPAGGPAVKLPKGEDAGSYRIVLRPHITEKGTALEGQGKYLFRVARSANKPEIKKSVEKLYNVKVEKVHILKTPSKFRQVGKYEGRRPGFKKAIVTLKEGERIEVTR